MRGPGPGRRGPRFPVLPAALGACACGAGSSAKAQLAGNDRSFPIGSWQTPFGLLRVFSVVIPFLYVGTQISKNFAALLEEHDIFVPEDDDDDD
ncbi:PREDICTED: essential MCU regulator, mitochondrial [Pterocles gutturalis]|nr:PREDICTED: essential MCU regulator, mitochondrial [Pterocles gutturalis]